MPIETQCNNCAKKIKVPDKFAGLKAKCPNCHAILDLPGTPVAGADAADVAPASVSTIEPTPAPPVTGADLWYLKTEEGEEYGPVTKEELNTWVEEGRVDAACQVRRSETEAFRPAGEVYPELLEAPAPVVSTDVELPASKAPVGPHVTTESKAVSIVGLKTAAGTIAGPPGEPGSYPALRTASRIYLILAWISVAIGVLTSLLVAVAAIALIVSNPTLSGILNAIGILLAGLVIVAFYTLFAFITLKALSEIIRLAMHVQSHSQRTAAATERMAELMAQERTEDHPATPPG